MLKRLTPEQLRMLNSTKMIRNLRMVPSKPEPLCGCQEGMVGPQFCAIHGEFPYPVDGGKDADSFKLLPPRGNA